MIKDIVVIIGNYCNLKCPYCLQNAGESNLNELPIEDVIKFLDTLPYLEDIKITGGEPLSDKNYDRTYKLAQYGVKRGVNVQINTNGTFPSSHFDLDNDKVSFQVSLDGLEKEHDQFRGRGVFKKAVDFIKLQKSHGYKIHVMSVISNQFNMRSFEEFIDYITITLFIPLSIQFAGPVGRANNLNVNSDKDFTINFDKVQGLISSRAKNKFIKPINVRDRKKHCYFVHEEEARIGIDECGNIIPCPMLGKYKFGTIYDYDEERVHKEMHDKIYNCTCSYPDGYEGECK